MEHFSESIGMQDDRHAMLNAAPLVVFVLLAFGALSVATELLVHRLLPGLPLEQFEAVGKSGGFAAVFAGVLSRPAFVKQWLTLLATVSMIIFVGHTIAVICALVAHESGLTTASSEETEAPLRAGSAMLGVLVMTPFVGGLGKAGLLPGFHWPVWWEDDTPEPNGNGFFPPRFSNFMGLVAVMALFAGSVPLLLGWTARNWPASPLTLIQPDFAGILLFLSAGLAILTKILAPKGWRPWPLTTLVALLGGCAMAALIAAFAATSSLWAWRDADPSSLSAIATGLPGLALVPLGIAAWRTQTSGPKKPVGEVG